MREGRAISEHARAVARVQRRGGSIGPSMLHPGRRRPARPWQAAEKAASPGQDSRQGSTIEHANAAPARMPKGSVRVLYPVARLKP